MSKRKPRVCVDLDATLADYTHWNGLDNIGDPIPGAKDFLAALKPHAHIIIYTVRTNPEWNSGHTRESLIAKVQNWLNLHEMPYDEVSADAGKPVCEAFVDDRAVTCRPLQDITAYQNALQELAQMGVIE